MIQSGLAFATSSHRPNRLYQEPVPLADGPKAYRSDGVSEYGKKEDASYAYAPVHLVVEG
jgi:hypothetical protein